MFNSSAMHQLACVLCKSKFENAQPHSKFCGIECRNKRNAYKLRRNVTGPELFTGTVGAIAELAVCTSLLEKGYSVFRSVSPSSPFDLVVYVGEKVFKLEVRTGYMDLNGKLYFPMKSRAEIDFFAVRERNTGEIFYQDKNKNFINFDPCVEIKGG